MKKLSFILSLLLVIGCEDEDSEKSPLVGTWTMTESSGGIYMMVNKTQYIREGKADGEVRAVLYSDQGTVDSFSMTDFNVDQTMDGTFIMISTPYDTNLPSEANYVLSDYVSSLDDYDYSQLNVNSMNDYYDFYNMSGNNEYSIEVGNNGMNTVFVLDTLYRQIYINGNAVYDSSRYSIVSGTIEEIGTQIQANQPIKMMDDDIGLPSALTLTLNADFTGIVEEAFEGNSMVSDIRWFVTPDSLFGWEYCGLDGDDDECDGGPVFNNIKVTENSLTLGMHQDMCEEYNAMGGQGVGFDSNSGYCDEIMYNDYGVEIGTFDSFWAEINVSMVKSNTSKEYISTNQSQKLNNNPRSVFQEIAKQKKAYEKYKEGKMNRSQLICALVILMFSFSLQAQNETILFGQQKAINNLSSDAGLSANDLDSYLKKRYKKPLYQLTQTEGAEIINSFQDGTLSKNVILGYINPQQQIVQNIQPNNQQSSAQNKDLIAASILEVGMKKRFHFKDGSISEGEITGVDNDLVTLVTESGEFKIPKDEFLAETAEITNKKGEKFVGHVLKETQEEFSIRTQYGDAVIHKRNIEKMSRYHGGIRDPQTEMTKRFYIGEASLLSVFLDPTANLLAPNTFYLSGMSLGYGLTDRFMLTTKYASNFNGDLNLHPRLRFRHNKSADKESSMSVGLGFHRSYPVKSTIGKYAHAIKVDGKSDTTINLVNLEIEDVMKDPNIEENPVYVEAYLVYTSHRTNPTGRGKVGWTVGGKISNAFQDNIQGYLKTGYTFDEENYKIPYRLWASLDYDLRKDLKFVASTWIDNGYRSMDAGDAFQDYIGSDDSTPLSIDSIKGKKSMFDFDFGLLYAPTDNFRIGVHFQQPFIDFYWEFFEF